MTKGNLVCTDVSALRALVFNKGLVRKHLSDCYLRSFYVMQLSTAHTHARTHAHTHTHTHTHRGNNVPARGLQGEVKD